MNKDQIIARLIVALTVVLVVSSAVVWWIG